MLIIDVLICSHNESDALPELLESLRKQTIPPDRFNIIFVDNASNDDTKEIVHKYKQELKNLRYVFEPTEGKSFALNTGYQLAKSEYVAHIDADCKANENWIANIIKVIDEENPHLLGGPYFPYYSVSKPKWYKDKYNSSDLGKGRIFLDDETYLSGANMIWKKSLVLGLGGHNTTLGITESSLAGGEDTELILRARQNVPDFKAVYDSSIFVYHLTKEKCFSIEHLFCRSFFTGKRHSLFMNQDYTYINTLRKIFLTIVKIIASILRGIVFRNKNVYPYYKNFLYEVIAPQFYTFGYYYGAYLRKFLSKSRHHSSSSLNVD